MFDTQLIDELNQASIQHSTIRIPEGRNIKMTARVQDVIDHPAFQRLRQVRMLGPIHLIYPGAVHTRFEHSLGVYDYIRQFLLALMRHKNFAMSVSHDDMLTVLAAGLLHDIGHYPFAHSLEALHIQGRDTPRHEDLGAEIIRGNIDFLRGSNSIAHILRHTWGINPERVIAICTGKWLDSPSQIDSILYSIISGAIDADKMDYLERDSHHLGVPYGRNYDRERLMANITLNADETAIALHSKGKISAEMFIFSRYTMFSEVYWHHTARAASAMVDNALAAFQSRTAVTTAELQRQLLLRDDDRFLEWVRNQTPANSATNYLLNGLSLNHRRLYKRIATFSKIYVEKPKQRAYAKIYAMDAPALYDLTARLTARLSSHIGRALHPADIVIDIPPRDKDKMDTIEMHFPNVSGQTYYPLHSISRIVAGIQDDFISVVKKIRLFASPQLASELRDHRDLEDILLGEILKR